MRHGRAQSRSSGFFAGAAIVLGALVLVSQLPFLAGARGQLRGTLAPFEAGATAVESATGQALSVGFSGGAGRLAFPQLVLLGDELLDLGMNLRILHRASQLRCPSVSPIS